MFSQRRKKKALTGASFRTPHVHAMAGNPLIDGGIIESCNTEVAQVMCPEKL